MFHFTTIFDIFLIFLSLIFTNLQKLYNSDYKSPFRDWQLLLRIDP